MPDSLITKEVMALATQVIQLKTSAILIALGSVAGAATGTIKFIKYALTLAKRRHAVMKERGEYAQGARQSFLDGDLKAASKNFIEQDCSIIDPSREIDLRAVARIQEPVLDVINKEIRQGETRYLLILADSGMGKTTLLLNLLARDIASPPSKRRGFVMVSLSRDDALARIAAINSKTDKILLLDAFDEDAEAVGDHRTRMREIVRASRDFSAVILTCRTQFFAAEDEIPREVGVLRIDALPAGEDRVLVFKKLYLLPYSDDQIRRYLRMSIGWWRLRQRKLAYSLVKRIHDLAARPMLLSVVPSLVAEGREVNEVFEVYRFMVESWFKRERAWIDHDSLRLASIRLSVDMIKNRTTRGTESIPSLELDGVIGKLTQPVEKWKLESRSLLNRDGGGNLKFSHRSIMEFFFVLAAIEGSDTALEVEWTDQMKEFLFSWGRTDSMKIDAARRIICRDPRKSKILPINFPEAPFEVNATTIEVLLSLPAPRSILRGFPKDWASLALRIDTSHSQNIDHVYEFSDDISWSIPKVPRTYASKSAKYTDFDQVYGPPGTESRDTSRHNDSPWRTSLAALGGESTVPLVSFSNLLLLVGNLINADRLISYINAKELYWAGNTKSPLLVNIRSSDERPWEDENIAQLLTVSSNFVINRKILGRDMTIAVFTPRHKLAAGVLIDCGTRSAIAEYYH